MSRQDPQQAIRQIRHDVVESSARVLLGFATLLFAVASFRSWLIDGRMNPIHVAMYGLSLVFYGLRGRLPVERLGLLMLAQLLGAAAMGLLTFGLAGQSMVMLFGLIYLTTTLFGARAGAIACASSLGLIVVAFLSQRLGWLRQDVDPAAYLSHPMAWVMAAATLVAMSLMMRSQTAAMTERMVSLWLEQERRAQALRETNVKLRDEVAERRRVEATLREREQSYRDLFSLSPDAVFVVHEERITDLNAAAQELIGVSQASRVIGTRLDQWVLATQDTGAPDEGPPAPLPALTSTDPSTSGREVRLRQVDGGLRSAELRTALARIDGGQAMLVSLRDITDRKKVEARVLRMAQHDTLTDLPNRSLLETRIAQALRLAGERSRRVALLFIDLDRFKTINDTLGHATGDQLLVEVGRRLSAICRSQDLLARLGGDEYVLLLPDVERTEEITAVAERVLISLREPVRLERYEVTATPSIGISTFPDDGEDGESLLKHADAAMYQAKAAGRNTYRFFLPEMNRAALDRIALEQKLRNALRDDGFELHYQMQVDHQRRFVGMEALLRWTLPDEGRIGPDRFIPIAEEIGLIVPLGEWVLERACRQAREWLDTGMPAFRISVNLSPAQLRNPDFLPRVESILQRHQIPPGVLELEITESAAMENPRAAIEVLGGLKRLGLMLAIDDFGTGYSSLSYLKLFPIDHLKIDRSFVRDLVDDPNDRAIARATIALAHSLGLRVIAEGVETEDQADMLVMFGCDEMQGYLYGRPEPIEALAARLRPETVCA